MTRLRYVDRNFASATLRTIEQANAIVEEYAAQGFDLTLRQLYYQFVSRDLIANKQSEYKRLGSIVNDARLAGLMDWDRIVDRTRSIRALSHWDDPAAIMDAAASSYREEVWARQPLRVEVWIEKDALVGVFEPICEELDVPVFSCRGYTSQSEAWAAGQRLGRYIGAGQRVLILHFGDHDPSGLDMTRDIRERLELFLRHDWVRALFKRHPELYDVPADGATRMEWIGANAKNGVREPWDGRLEVRRMALTWDQIRQYGPPPNPAKDTDARFAKYAEEHGDESWELDALEPTVLAELVRAEVEAERDADVWDAAVEEQERRRELLSKVSDRWAEIEDFLA